MNLRKLLSIAFAGAMLLGAASVSKAESIIITFLGQTPLGPNLFEYSYNATLAEGLSNTQLQSGDFFTVFDFAGYNGFATPPNLSGPWTITSANLGVNPPTIPVNPFDSAAVPNVTFTYNGATINAPQDLGTFTIRSTIGSTTPTGFYAAQDHQLQIAGPQSGQYTASGNNGFTTVPAAVPVPASAWAGLVLLGVVFGRRQLAKLTA